jgi:hypothetical protein
MTLYSTLPPSSAGTAPSLFEQLQPAHSVESVLRLYHLDAALHLKLSSLFDVSLAMVLEVWRLKHDMDAVVASGVWPFIGYVDLQTAGLQLAGGRAAEFRTAIRAGRLTTADRSDGMLVLATEVDVLAQRGGGKAQDFMHVAESAREPAAKLRVMNNLVRPMAVPSERAVRVMPPELQHLDVAPCAPAPSTAELLLLPEGTSSSARVELRGRWAQHHTDANQLVYSNEYVRVAENACGELAHLAGLPPNALHMLRGQLAPKRPFFAGQEYWARADLQRSADGKHATALIAFHGAAAPGVAEERPSTAVRIDAAIAIG